MDAKYKNGEFFDWWIKKLIAERRNISDYENKSKEDLLKAFTKPKSKIEIKNNKLKKNRKDFYNLRHTFSKN